MRELSALGKQRREELIEDVAEKLLDTVDMDVPWSSYAEAVIELLETRGLLSFQSKNCPSCGRDRQKAEYASCTMGGCPCGGDL